jgi:hypothetical protein
MGQRYIEGDFDGISFLFIVKTKRTHHPNFITFNTANKDVFFVVDETNMISGMIFYFF